MQKIEINPFIRLGGVSITIVRSESEQQNTMLNITKLNVIINMNLTKFKTEYNIF